MTEYEDREREVFRGALDAATELEGEEADLEFVIHAYLMYLDEHYSGDYYMEQAPRWMADKLREYATHPGWKTAT